MKNKPIILIAGEPNSIFFEIFFKSIKIKKYKSPLILICSQKLLKQQMKELKFKKNLKLLDINLINEYNLDNKSINIINVDLKISSVKNINNKLSRNYIFKIF